MGDRPRFALFAHAWTAHRRRRKALHTLIERGRADAGAKIAKIRRRPRDERSAPRVRTRTRRRSRSEPDLASTHPSRRPDVPTSRAREEDPRTRAREEDVRSVRPNPPRGDAKRTTSERRRRWTRETAIRKRMSSSPGR
jgi:hypothetical protein